MRNQFEMIGEGGDVLIRRIDHVRGVGFAMPVPEGTPLREEIAHACAEIMLRGGAVEITLACGAVIRSRVKKKRVK